MKQISTTSGNALERRQALRSFLGVSPALVSIGLFLIVPIFIVVGYSLMQANPVRWG
jgi:hypothetical protein